ncbi:MAG TPA: AAA family ATPase [Virgibacillus sp.]|nr:AAA family ATPase [Virgibacillus sp.]
MKKIRMVVADNNKDYLESFAGFMRSSNESSRFIMTYFSDIDRLNTYIQRGDIIDILLISPDLYDEELPLSGDVTTIFLEDDVIEESNKAYSVYRYQRLDQILSDILSVYYEKNKIAGEMLARSKETQIFAVFSPSGGSGKTTIAVNLCKQLALNDLKVFYLNSETFNTSRLYFSSQDDDYSLKILYYVKSKTEQLLSKIEQLKKHDPDVGVDYFDLETNAEEMLELTEKEIHHLLNGLVQTGAYDYIIVDLDSSIHTRNIAMLKESDWIVWPMGNNPQSIYQSESFFEEEENVFGKKNIIKDKLLVLLNKHTGHNAFDLSEAGFPIDGNLPFINEWTQQTSGKEVMENEMFNNELQKIIRNKILVLEGEQLSHG